MATINIDGRTFQGSSVSIRNGRVTVDGVEQAGNVHGTIELRIEGKLDKLECDGNVTCGDVLGSVLAGGSVQCKNVGGVVQAGGSVRAEGHIKGTIQAGGSVRIG